MKQNIWIGREKSMFLGGLIVQLVWGTRSCKACPENRESKFHGSEEEIKGGLGNKTENMLGLDFIRL